MELSETRKRARLSLEEVFEEYNSSKEVEGPDGKGLEESSEINLCETSVGLKEPQTSSIDQKAADKMLDDFDVTAFMLNGRKFLQEKRVKRSNSIGEADKSTNCQSARIVFKDEHSAKAAVAHNNMEFNGNRLHVTAAHAGVAKEVCVPMDESWSIFVSNTPTDVKDEELFDLFSGSLKVDVTAVRVIRQPQTGLSKGTAYVYFKTQADVSRLLSSRHTLTLRGRVLRISRALASIQAEQKSKQPQSTKHSSNPGMDDNSSRKKDE
ncbi:hypothetical protein L7F22_035087 [Adiantum nelumboides]|nr:hypothetical protein [Adiantum nelumboides]